MTGSIIQGEEVHPGERVVTPVEGRGYVSHKEEWGEGISLPGGGYHLARGGVYHPGGCFIPSGRLCITQGEGVYQSSRGKGRSLHWRGYASHREGGCITP